MPALIDIERAVADWLLSAMPGRALVKRDDSDAGAPAGKCIVYGLQSTSSAGRPRSTIGESVQTVAAPSMIRVLLQFLGGDAFGDATRAALSLYATQRTSDLYRVAGLMSVGEVQDRTALELATMQARADVEIVLSAVLTFESAPESIDSVQITTPSATFTVTRGVDPHACESD